MPTLCLYLNTHFQTDGIYWNCKATVLFMGLL